MLKDLVWKKIDKEKELENLKKQWDIYYESIINTNDDYDDVFEFLFNNAEQIAKEKQEILNKKAEYTKEDIVNMFVEAGFEWDKEQEILTSKDKVIIKFGESQFYFYLRLSGHNLGTIWIKFNDRKSIEFYYNIFREILEFETNKENE